LSQTEKITQQTKHKVMIVDDSAVNLQVARTALSESYTIIPATSGATALSLLEKITPSLILLDIEMPEVDGFETIKLLKGDAATRDIPVIFLTAISDGAKEFEGFSYGAVDYIIKPFSPRLLLQRVKLHIELVEQRRELQNYNSNLMAMVDEKTATIEELQHAIIFALSDLIDSRDGLTGGHVRRTQRYMETLTDALVESGTYAAELEGMDLSMWLESAQLHDIGKVGISDNILRKPGRLTADEFDMIKTHTTIGESALHHAMEKTRDKNFLRYAATVAATHHEKWDGSGYPNGLKGAEIPLIGRLMAIADVYDALVSARPYKDAYTHERAVEIIAEEAGRHFDPLLVELFKQNAHLFALIENDE